MPTFELLPLTWEAAATFFTGVLAVAAAWNVGRRQTSILDRQTRIAENDLKIQLFEKRSHCVGRMRELCSVWSEEGRLELDQMSEFQSLLFDVQILFPEKLILEFEEAFSSSLCAAQWHQRARYYHDRNNETKAQELFERACKHEDRANDLMPELLTRLKTHTRPDVWDE